MVDSYLSKLLNHINVDSGISNAVGQALSGILTEVSANLRLKVIAINEQKRNFSILIEKNREKMQEGTFEATLRKAHLREVKRKKRELEEKLGHITRSIEQLNTREEMELKRPNLQNEQTRREYYEELKKKSEENTKKTKEYYAEQRRRHDKVKAHLEELN